MIRVAAEQPSDVSAIRRLNVAAFETAAEADLVDALRGSVAPFASLVARHDDGIVGHLILSPVTLSGATGLWLGLGPMAVAPSSQRQGVGSQLVVAALERAAALSAVAVVVLGHPGFYPRFGFELASEFGIGYRSAAYAPYFFVHRLSSGPLPSGLVTYSEPFESLA